MFLKAFEIGKEGKAHELQKKDSSRHSRVKTWKGYPPYKTRAPKKKAVGKR